MNGNKGNTEETEWTKENLQKLLAALKSNTTREKDSVYTKGLRAVDWSKVAFPPFSPEQCEEKWTEFMQKMRKIRTLTELIEEAELVVSNPSQNKKIHPEFPKRPGPPNALYFEDKWAKYHEKHPHKKMKKPVFKEVNKEYNKLPEEEKALYEERFQLKLDEYNRRMEEFRKEYRSKAGTCMKKKGKEKTSTEDLPSKPPSNGYSLYCKEKGSSIEGGVQAWARGWRALTDAQRTEYNKRCKEMQAQYQLDMQKIVPDSPKFVKEFPGEPKMPARRGYTFFIQKQMKIRRKDSSKKNQCLSEINHQWQSLTDNERKVYSCKVEKNFSKYCQELSNWFKALSPEEQAEYRKTHPKKCQNLKESSEKPNTYRPSDSEDEDIEESNSDEEPFVDCREAVVKEEEEERIEGDDMFELF